MAFYAQIEVAANTKAAIYTFPTGTAPGYRYTVNIIVRNSADENLTFRLGRGVSPDIASTLPNNKWFAEFTLQPQDSGEQTGLMFAEGDIIFAHNLGVSDTIVITVQGIRESNS